MDPPSIEQLLDCLQNPDQQRTLPGPILNSSVFRLLHLVSNYSSLKSKAGTSTAAVAKEHLVERILKCLLEMLKLEDFEVSLFWEMLPHFLSALCLSKENSSEEIRLSTLLCVQELLLRSKKNSTSLSEDLKLDLELRTCLAFLICKCFTRIHDEHPKGDWKITKAAFAVLKTLLEVFNEPVIWYGILPSAVSELSAFLAQIGGWVENKDAVLPLSTSTVEAIEVLTKLIILVFSEEQLPLNYHPPKNSPLSILSLQSIIKGEKTDSSKSSELNTSAEEGSPKWFEFSIQKIVSLLSVRIPPLVHHPSPNVRSALAKAVTLLLKHCAKTLNKLYKELIRLLLILSVDDYPKVSEACLEIQSALKERLKTEGRNSEFYSSFEGLIRTGMDSLPLDLSTSELKGCSTIKTLSSAINIFGPLLFDSWLTEDPPFLQTLHRCLSTGFAFDDRMVKTVVQGSRPGLITGLIEESRDHCSSQMPVALLHLTNQTSYNTFAKFVEILSGSMSLKGFRAMVDVCLDELRTKVEVQDEHWTLSVASTIVSISHLILGIGIDQFKSQHEEIDSRSDALLTIIIHVLETIEDLNLWLLETGNLKSCENAILVSSVLDLVSVIGRVLGETLRTTSCKVMSLILIHLFERLADPCSFVQSTAQSTINLLCVSVDVDSLGELIVEFGDYIVDGVCTQLSDLDNHPMAPYLLSALFNHAQVLPRSVLPLLSEPASHALQGLSIMSRVNSPQFSIPFLRSLKVMADCGRLEAEEGQLQLTQVLNRKIAEKSKLTDEELNLIQQQIHGLHSAATLADGVVNLTAPLFSHSDPQISVMSFEACLKALHVLQVATSADDLCKTLISGYLSPASIESMKVVPEVPKMHPMIGPIWRSLISALKNRSIPIIEKTVEFVGEIMVLFEGKTLSRRFKDEAWPLLKKLLTQGVIHQPSKKLIPQGSRFLTLVSRNLDLEDSINARLRCQRAVLSCLEVIGLDDSARSCLNMILREILETVFSFFEKSDFHEIQESVFGAIKGLALVDADLVWWKLKGVNSSPSSSSSNQRSEDFKSLLTFVENSEVLWYKEIQTLLDVYETNNY